MKVKLKNEKKSGRREKGVRRGWFSPGTRDGNQSPWKQHESADRVVTFANTHTHTRRRIHTQTRAHTQEQ